MPKLKPEHKTLGIIATIAAFGAAFIVVNFINQTRFGNIAGIMYVISMIVIFIIYPKI